MTRSITLGVLVILLLATPAAAWDPEEDDRSDWWPPAAVWEPEPAPVPPPPGIYLVTDTYAGDVVSQSGNVTTYATETVHETTGSYARVLETVDTGGSSAYDGAAFNGRTTMTDGRSVAGTYYENYVRAGDTFLPVSVVFFQDDAEIARAARVAPPPPPAAAPAPVLLLIGQPPVAAVPAGPNASVAPIVEGPAPAPGAPARPVSLTPTLLPDRAIEVLRGRRIAVSLDGTAVRAWRLVSGNAVVLGLSNGNATDAFVARWDALAAPGSVWVVRFAIDLTDGTSRELALRVSVRAPGLVE
ncbi:MAG TPA: hypothetical protein VGA38_05690 [Candidatus Limnocylindria bacterium]